MTLWTVMPGHIPMYAWVVLKNVFMDDLQGILLKNIYKKGILLNFKINHSTFSTFSILLYDSNSEVF